MLLYIKTKCSGNFICGKQKKIYYKRLFRVFWLVSGKWIVSTMLCGRSFTITSQAYEQVLYYIPSLYCIQVAAKSTKMHMCGGTKTNLWKLSHLHHIVQGTYIYTTYIYYTHYYFYKCLQEPRGNHFPN